MTPTARTLQALRSGGWDVVEVVERWIPGANIRRDFLGIGDVLAVNPDSLLLIQATSDANMAARIHKAQSEPRLRTWLQHPSRRFEVWGWDGNRCRIVPVVLGDVQDVVAVMPERRKPRPMVAGLFGRVKV